MLLFSVNVSPSQISQIMEQLKGLEAGRNIYAKMCL
jgi:hypothetical protein